MGIDDKVQGALPEGTIVITDVSQLSLESQELFTHYGWTLGSFQDMYHKALVLGQRFKTHSDGLLMQTKDHKGYELDTNIERVLGEKAETGKDGVTKEKMYEMLAAVAVKYFEILAKQAPVSIDGTTQEEWGLFKPDSLPITKMDKMMFDLLAQGYRHRALTPDEPFHYSTRTAPG